MRPSRVLLPVALLVAAACSGDGDATEQAGETDLPSSHALDTTTSTALPPESTTTAAPGTTAAPAPSATTATTRRTAPTTSVTAPPGTTVTSAAPVPPAPAVVPLTEVNLRLSQVVNFGTNFGPLDLAQRPGDDTLYVAGQRGRVMAVRNGAIDATPVLDLSAQVRAGGEQGLLGITFSPDGNLIYVSFTDTAGDSRLVEFAFRDGRVDTATRRDLIFIDDIFGNHIGGQVTFGPDGLLYFWMGDGGGQGDPQGNAQSLGTLLGKVLRIDPKPSGGQPYTIPPDNPFVGRDGARGEIYAFGLRNPWRNSFDRATGDLWMGDVGAGAREEIDWCPRDAARGANFGWAAWEGTRTGPRPVPPAENAVPPVHEYPTGDGCAVTGGYVYRGSRIPALVGAYLFGDFCNGRIQGLRLVNGRVVEHRVMGPQVDNLSSFGQDHQGEHYALSLAGGLFRIDPA